MHVCIHSTAQSVAKDILMHAKKQHPAAMSDYTPTLYHASVSFGGRCGLLYTPPFCFPPLNECGSTIFEFVLQIVSTKS